MQLKIFQKGFNYSQDGQGNRLVYHLQGCNMHCPWCANPEGMPLEGAIYTEADWLRPELCPYGAITEDGRAGYRLHFSACEECEDRKCLVLPHKGIRLSCQEVAVDDVYDEILRSSPLFYDGGGVTFTGGEATLQFEPLKALLMRLKDANIHTVLETNGSHPRLKELFPFIDQLIMDLKHWNEECHKRFTGRSLKIVKENLVSALAYHGQLDIRIPLIGGVNDSLADQEGFLHLLKEITEGHDQACITIEILKYHEFGKNKWSACGWEYAMTETAHVTWEQIGLFREQLIANGYRYKKS